jgi:hypothetical protein
LNEARTIFIQADHSSRISPIHPFPAYSIMMTTLALWYSCT